MPFNEESLAALRRLLAVLRAAHWAHWTFHWQSSGPNSYEDHQMFGRLYEGMAGEIDSLAEKMVQMAGNYAVDAAETMKEALGTLEEVLDGGAASPEDRYRAALDLEALVQDSITDALDILEETDTVTLGLDDFLASTANAHETAEYLLGQKLR